MYHGVCIIMVWDVYVYIHVPNLRRDDNSGMPNDMYLYFTQKLNYGLWYM